MKAASRIGGRFLSCRASVRQGRRSQHPPIPALFEALAGSMHAGGFDPTWGTYIVSLARRQPGEPIEIVSVATAPRCDALTRTKLIAAARKWLTPRRRSAFKSIMQLHLEINAASVWETTGGPLDSREAAELDLLGLPAAGTA